ncbi:infection structure specific protein [Colletotrichum graminicola M1.001]|uniref:Infection structure specific protein n=1 Tax=Colletotrichum graminicola (strain M1.001 / M2 / FGSC 10212) TaxID=645133 RepID=E3QV78_COLGM|nr:infection structure specific protein [Colletotrichum graminicola M1.001]EFQ34768.1 infection structure specific protein [Colletotrichum graminicola M1.001]
MYSKTALVAALAGSATAVFDVRPERIRREVLPRQTDIAADPCLNVLNTVYANAPTPPPKIVSYEMTAPHQTDPCSITVPAELSAEYASYTSEVLSWVDANSASIQSALSVCSTITGISASIPVCSATAGSARSGATASGSSSPKATEGGDSPGSGTGTAAGSNATGTQNSPSQVTPNAGPRETGMMAAAIVAAGFIGVAAFL